MRKFLTMGVALVSLSACGVPAAVAIPFGLVAGTTVDRVVNIGIGRTAGYTVSGEDGKLAAEGNDWAAWRCQWYEPLGLYDLMSFSQKEHKVLNREGVTTHCGRWYWRDSGKLDALVAVEPDLAVPLPPRDAKHGLRVVR